MSTSSYLGYQPGTSAIHRLSGTTKLLAFLAISIITMASFDTFFLLAVGALSVYLFYLAKIDFQTIKGPMLFIFFFSLLNIVMIYLFAPEQGVEIYGSRHVIWEGIGRYSLTWEQVLYELNVALKYFTTIPLGFIFILTTHPSEFSSSLNKIGVPYTVSYAVSLALRYIPEVQAEFISIRQSQQARGIELSSKAKFFSRLKHSASILLPLIFSSLDRIEVVSQAMELRRFGKEEGRTWYAYRPFSKADYLALAGVFIIVLVGIGLFFVHGGRFWNPFQSL